MAAEAGSGHTASVANHGTISGQQVQANSQSGDIFIDTGSAISGQNIALDAAEITGGSESVFALPENLF